MIPKLFSCALAAVVALVACSRSAAVESAVVIDAQVPTASIANPAVASDAAAGGAFGAACVSGAECATGVCFHKRIKGPDAGRERRGDDGPVEHAGYCSMRCADDTDCPVPLTKGRCGARGMCKRAE